VDGACGPEGYGRLTAAGCVERGDGSSGRRWWIALRHAWGARVLKIDRPLAGRFLGLTGLWPEGCGIALRAMSIKPALRACLPVLIVILTPGEES
jgi:hypothetical protein